MYHEVLDESFRLLPLMWHWGVDPASNNVVIIAMLRQLILWTHKTSHAPITPNFSSTFSREIVVDYVHNWVLVHHFSHYYSLRCWHIVSKVVGVTNPSWHVHWVLARAPITPFKQKERKALPKTTATNINRTFRVIIKKSKLLALERGGDKRNPSKEYFVYERLYFLSPYMLSNKACTKHKLDVLG